MASSLPASSPRGPATVGRAFAALGIGEAGARLVSFAATLYLARRLGVSGYGTIALASAVLLYFSAVADLGIDTLGVAEVRRSEHPGPLVSGLVLGRLLAAVLLQVTVAVLALTLMPQPDGAILAAMAAVILMRGGNVRWALLGRDRARAVAIARFTGELAGLALLLVMVHASGDLGRVPAAQVAADGIAALLLLVSLGRSGVPLAVEWRRDVVMPVFRAARPLVFHSLLALLVFNCDLILLRFFRDSSTVGYYAAAYTLVSFLSNLGVTFGYSLLPALAALDHDDAARGALFGSSLAQVAAMTLPLAVGGTLVAGGLVRLVFGAAFARSALPLAILLWSVPPVWMRTVAQMGLVAAGRQGDVLRITVVGAALTVALDLAIIPRWGMTGAAAVTVFAELVRVVLSMVLSRRSALALPSPLRFVRPLLASLAMGAVVWLIAPRVPVLAAVALGGAVYALLLFLTGALRLDAGGVAVRL